MREFGTLGWFYTGLILVVAAMIVTAHALG